MLLQPIFYEMLFTHYDNRGPIILVSCSFEPRIILCTNYQYLSKTIEEAEVNILVILGRNEATNFFFQKVYIRSIRMYWLSKARECFLLI